jgi:MSHA biogenesis protein MshQ
VRVRILAGAGCSSDRFAIRPTSLTAGALDFNWQQPYLSGASRTLNNTSAQGGVVHAASESGATTPRPFTLTAAPQAAGGQSASRYDGVPTVVSGFPACISPPTSCATGTLTFTPGAWTGTGTRSNATAHYSEAGVLNLRLEDTTFAVEDANDGSVPATRTIPPSGSSSIGRFVPDRLQFTAPNVPQLQTFGSACASRSFTYIGQPFWYATLPSATLQGVNANGTVTTNYKGFGDGSDGTSLFHLTAAGIAETYSNNAVGSTLNTGSAVSPPQLTSVGSGTATYTAKASAANVDLSYTRSLATPAAPFSATISLSVTATDSSENAGPGVPGNPGNSANPPGPMPPLTTSSALVFNGGGSGIAFDGSNFSVTLTGGKTFVYGRARISNAYGPGQVDLPVDLRAEYYDGTFFVTNAKDQCTAFAPGNFQLIYAGGSSTIDATNLGASHITISGPLVSGIGSLRLTKPSPQPASPGGATLCLDLDTPSGIRDASCQGASAANMNYLQGPWSGGNYDKDPKATVGFGIFGAQPKSFIYFRENY